MGSVLCGSTRIMEDGNMLRIPICLRCTHMHPIDKEKEVTCDAFPDGIPQKVLFNSHYHITPYPGDNGILFEFNEIDIDRPTMVRPPQCRKCAHQHPHTAGVKTTCDAFPAGVPVEILLNMHEHTEPYPGDNGILFKLKESSSG